MSYFVTITFDLKDASTAVYPKIHKDLATLDFSKYITGKKGIERKLPNNTFVAKFDDEFYHKSSRIAKWLKSEMKSIFRKHRVSGNYFIIVGKKWTWNRGKI